MAVLMYNGQPIASTKYGEMLQTMRDVDGVLKGDGTGNYAEASAIDLEYSNTTSGLTATNTQDAIDELDTQLAEKANQATTYNKTEVDNALALKANKAQEAWITPTLLNGATGDLKYRKNTLGRVEFIGSITSASFALPSFLMPTGYRTESFRAPVSLYATQTLGYVQFAGGRDVYFSTHLNGQPVGLSYLSYVATN